MKDIETHLHPSLVPFVHDRGQRLARTCPTGDVRDAEHAQRVLALERTVAGVPRRRRPRQPEVAIDEGRLAPIDDRHFSAEDDPVDDEPVAEAAFVPHDESSDSFVAGGHVRSVAATPCETREQESENDSGHRASWARAMFRRSFGLKTDGLAPEQVEGDHTRGHPFPRWTSPLAPAQVPLAAGQVAAQRAPALPTGTANSSAAPQGFRSEGVMRTRRWSVAGTSIARTLVEPPPVRERTVRHERPSSAETATSARVAPSHSIVPVCPAVQASRARGRTR